MRKSYRSAESTTNGARVMSYQYNNGNFDSISLNIKINIKQ